MKRIVRVFAVLVINSLVIFVMATRLLPERVTSPLFGNAQNLIEFFLEIAAPIAGVALELARWKFAKHSTVGYLGFAGCFWLIEAAYWRSDPFFGVLVIIGIALVILGGVIAIAYRWTDSSPEIQSVRQAW